MRGMQSVRAPSRLGIWLIGAKGGVATTVMTGLAALQRGAIDPVGLITATEPFAGLGLVEFSDLVVGGHDIRAGSLADEARRMWTESRAITPELLDGAAGYFADVERRLRARSWRPGIAFAASPTKSPQTSLRRRGRRLIGCGPTSRRFSRRRGSSM